MFMDYSAFHKNKNYPFWFTFVSVYLFTSTCNFVWHQSCPGLLQFGFQYPAFSILHKTPSSTKLRFFYFLSTEWFIQSIVKITVVRLTIQFQYFHSISLASPSSSMDRSLFFSWARLAFLSSTIPFCDNSWFSISAVRFRYSASFWSVRGAGKLEYSPNRIVSILFSSLHRVGALAGRFHVE